MLLDEIVEPIENFKAYSWRIERTVQTGQNNQIPQGQYYDTNAAGTNIYGGDAENPHHLISGFSYADLIKFFFTVYRAEISLNYTIQNKKTSREYNWQSQAYDYESFTNNITYTKNIVYHFANGSNATPNPNPDIALPHERACKDYGFGSNTWSLPPTADPNQWSGIRNIENISFLKPLVCTYNNSLSLALQFLSSYTPSPTEPDFLKRTTTIIDDVTFQYDNQGIERNPIKYLDFTATWVNSAGDTIKEWTGGKIPVGYNGWSQSGEYNESEILSASGSINYKFTSFDFNPIAPGNIEISI